MEKLKMHSPNLTQDNIARIRDLFPGCVTEAKGEDGSVKLAVDFDQLRQELAESIVEGPQERYHLNWPGKREALLTANAPIAKTLRPCRDESVNFDNITTDYVTANGDLGILYGDLNSHQLPTYHRLDITIKKWWDFSEFSRLEVAAGCTNAYNRANVFYFDRVAFKRVNQLPIMPSLSMNLSF